MDLRKYYDEIDSVRFPRDDVLINFEENDFIQKNKDLKLFFKEYIGEPILNPLISYLDMKTKCPNEIIDLRHQSDQTTPKKLNYFMNMPQILTMLDCLLYQLDEEKLN